MGEEGCLPLTTAVLVNSIAKIGFCLKSESWFEMVGLEGCEWMERKELYLGRMGRGTYTDRRLRWSEGLQVVMVVAELRTISE
jgi:hypothetical protein